MSKKKERPTVVGLYESVLDAMYCTTNEKGRVTNRFSGEVYKIGDKDVVVPTDELLANNDWTHLHPFHPLCEDLLHGQSDTVRWLIKRVAAALTLRVSTLAMHMVMVANSTALQGRVPDAKATAHLEPVSHAKDSTLAGWGKMIASFKKNSPLLTLYVSRGEEEKGAVGFYRNAVISCPMTLDVEETAILEGVKLASKADKKMLVDLINYLLPANLLTFGSNGDKPYFMAIVGIFEGITAHLNNIVTPFKALASELNGFEKVNLDWTTWLKGDAIDSFIGLIPELVGNVGELSLDEKKRATNIDPELADLMGRGNIRATTPPWDEKEEERRDVAPKPVVSSSSNKGIDIMAGSDRDSDRDYDRRDRRDDRDRGPRIDIFGSDRRRDRNDRDRRDRDYRDDRRDRDDDRRPSRGGIDIMGGRR